MIVNNMFTIIKCGNQTLPTVKISGGDFCPVVKNLEPVLH